MHDFKSPTDWVALLLAVPDAKGILRFPSSNGPFPVFGLMTKLRPLLPVGPQLMEMATGALSGVRPTQIELYLGFAEELEFPEQGGVTLFVGRLAPSAEWSAPAHWPPLPDILRGLPKDRVRLVYLKAWQVLTGALQLDTKAVEVDDLARELDA